MCLLCELLAWAADADVRNWFVPSLPQPLFDHHACAFSGGSGSDGSSSNSKLSAPPACTLHSMSPPLSEDGLPLGVSAGIFSSGDSLIDPKGGLLSYRCDTQHFLHSCFFFVAFPAGLCQPKYARQSWRPHFRIAVV